jgi:hypothetical protein
MWEDLDFREKNNIAHNLAVNTQEYKMAMRELMIERWADENFRSSQIERFADPLFRKQQSEATNKLWENEDYRDNFLKKNELRWQDPLQKEMMSLIKKTWWEDPEVFNMMSKITTNLWQDPEYREKQCNERKIRCADPEYLEQMSRVAKKAWDDNPEWRKTQSERYRGENSTTYDSTIYHFVHKDGHEEFCTKYNLYTKYALDKNGVYALVRGDYKTTRGWRISRDDKYSNIEDDHGQEE